MNTMRELIIEQPGRLQWREAPAPKLSTGNDAIVKPLVVGRCDLDVAFVRGLAPVPSGSSLGHECIAEAVEIGSAVRSIRPGQHVIVAAQISCGTCRMCRRGFTGRCNAVPCGASFGMGRAGSYGGALAESLRVPFADAMLVPVPTSLDPVRVIGAADMALDAWRALMPALQERPEASVLIVGGLASVIGLYAVAIAHALGAARIVYWDADEARRNVAGKCGAATQSTQLDLEGTFGIIVDAGGDAQILRRAIDAAEPEAIFTSVVIYLDDTTPLPLRDMYFKGITFRTGRPNVRPPMEHVLRLCQAGHFRPDDVPTTVFAFEDAIEAWLSDDLRTAVDSRA